MIKMLLQHTRKQIKKLISLLVQDLYRVLSIQMTWELDHATENQVDKFILKIKSLETLKNKKQFLKVTTSNQLLVWPIQLLLKKEWNQFLMKWSTNIFWKLIFLRSIWHQSKQKPLETNQTLLLVTMIKKNLMVKFTGIQLNINICLVCILKTFFSMESHQIFVVKKTANIDACLLLIQEPLSCQCQNMQLISWVRKEFQHQVTWRNAIVSNNMEPWHSLLVGKTTNSQTMNGCSQLRLWEQAHLLKVENQT